MTNKILRCALSTCLLYFFSSYTAQAADFSIVSPKSESNFAAGSTVTVAVQRPSASLNDPVVILSSLPAFSSLLLDKSNTGIISIDASTPPGKYSITAVTEGPKMGSMRSSETVYIYVDPIAAPLGTYIPIPKVFISAIGHTYPTLVYATMPGGERKEMNSWKDFRCTTENAAVAVAASNCRKITAVGYGKSEFRWQWHDMSGRIPVTVSK